MGQLVVNKCSSFGLVHLTALGTPVRLKFLYLSFSSNYVMFACIVLMLFHQKDLYVLLPVLYSKCWILQIPHQDLQCCNSSSSPSIPREETFLTKKTFTTEKSQGKMLIYPTIVSHITTSSARALSCISPSYANWFSSSPAGTWRLGNVRKTKNPYRKSTL